MSETWSSIMRIKCLFCLQMWDPSELECGIGLLSPVPAIA